MNRILLHQIWNRRRRNIWIFLELLLAGYFLWMVIDPICVLTADQMIPRGYEQEGIYQLKLGAYEAEDGVYFHKDEDDEGTYARRYRQIVHELVSCPEVSSVALGEGNCFPNCQGWNGVLLRALGDTAKVHAQSYSYYQVDNNDPVGVLGLKDALTGEALDLPPTFFQNDRQVALSERLALRLFGTVRAVGRKITMFDSEHEVVGVFQNVKHFDAQQPYPLLLMSQPMPRVNSYIIWTGLLFRLKPEVDERAFLERFEREVVPRLNQGNFYYKGIKSFADYSREATFEAGITSKIRLSYTMATFALICIFLGMFGVFWMHAEDRRSEIGILRSLGASRGTVVRHFFFEMWLLVTVAFVLVLLAVFHYVNTEGLGAVVETFLNERGNPDPAFWQNHVWTRFAVVSAVTYVLLLCISFVAVCFPVCRALAVPPADALHEE